jgi:tRNA G18 (ribose-2'-O)-methylase SpoU
VSSITTIEDPADPRVAAYREIRERDLVGRHDGFIAEGEVVLRVLLDSPRHRPVSLLIAANRLDRLAGLLDQVPPGVPVYAASQAVMDTLAGFHIHRGILAVGRREPLPEAGALLSGLDRRAAVLVLIGIANHDNMGGIFRNAAAFGADAVLLDQGCCDPLYRKAIRVSVGGALLVPFARLEAGADPVALLVRHHFTPVALSPQGAAALAEVGRPERLAILLGAEGPGLPSELLARVRTVRIPMKGRFDSLNVATTSGIVLNHFLVHSSDS